MIFGKICYVPCAINCAGKLTCLRASHNFLVRQDFYFSAVINEQSEVSSLNKASENAVSRNLVGPEINHGVESRNSNAYFQNNILI